jgi:hypothetical protein
MILSKIGFVSFCVRGKGAPSQNFSNNEQQCVLFSFFLLFYQLSQFIRMLVRRGASSKIYPGLF